MGEIVIRPITAWRFKDVEALFSTDAIMRSCWDVWPRYTQKDRSVIDAALRAAPPERAGATTSGTNRRVLQALAARRRAPGLLAYDGNDAIGFISLGPRTDMRRIDASRATPRVDDVPVWVVPCFFVHREHRGRGVTVALLRAAVAYAARHGAPAVEGYPRADAKRVHESTAFFGTVEQFRRAGFKKVAGPRADLPKGWVPRYTMRAVCDPQPRRTATSKRRPAP